MSILLSPTDKRSNLMRSLVAHWRDEQHKLREANDDKSRDAVETAFLRGRLAQLKADIALAAEPQPAITQEAVGYADGT